MRVSGFVKGVSPETAFKRIGAFCAIPLPVFRPGIFSLRKTACKAGMPGGARAYNKSMKKYRIIETSVCFLLAGALCAFSFFRAIPALRKRADSEERTGVVRLWNVDTFEGGKGSRTAFLNRIAAVYEKEHPGVFVMVSSYTAEGAMAAFAKGNYPDMLSFGPGFSAAADKCLALEEYAFAGGETSGECRAVPWCRGGYALFSLTDDFGAVSGDNTVLSLGGNNLPLVAAAFLSLRNAAAEESVSAYVRFLGGKYRYLLGTQRDVCRFASRGAQVYCRPVGEFSDLYQYIAVLASDENDRTICGEYLETLLGRESQSRLTEIGMFSPFFDIYGADDGLADEMERMGARYTIGAFASLEGLKNANEAAKSVLDGSDPEVLKNFLKAI